VRNLDDGHTEIWIEVFVQTTGRQQGPMSSHDNDASHGSINDGWLSILWSSFLARVVSLSPITDGKAFGAVENVVQSVAGRREPD
jgi:hypothetical protein